MVCQLFQVGLPASGLHLADPDLADPDMADRSTIHPPSEGVE
jgi:hypothetical protein